MKRKNKKISSTALVDKIRRDLKKARVWKAGQVDYKLDREKSELETLKQRIEFELITARDYQDPQYVFPRNPLMRMIKKALLRLMRVFTRYQIVFNKNVIFLLGDIYRYLELLEKKIDEKSGYR